MAYKYVSRKRTYRKRTPYKRTKKYGKKYGRSRFKNKRFRSTGYTNVSRNLIARNQFVKLPWSYTDRATFTTSSLDPIKYAFSGNGNSPANFTDNNPISSGQTLPRPAGFSQYASFYNKARIHGSSIKLELLTNSGTDQASNTIGQAVRVCLLALPYESSNIGLGYTTHTGAGNWADSVSPSPKNITFVPASDSTLSTMWNATYEHLINHPYAKWFTLGGSAASSRCTMKMFRKTKTMSQVKDLKDNDEFEFNLRNYVGDEAPSAKEGFVYFLYVFPTKAATSQDSIVLTVKMKYYYEFFDFIPQNNQAYTDTPA